MFFNITIVTTIITSVLFSQLAREISHIHLAMVFEIPVTVAHVDYNCLALYVGYRALVFNIW
jgi:hypothetical protein